MSKQSAQEGASLLKVNNLVKDFGGLRAVNGCSFEVDAGLIFGLIGPNGSGKSTLFNMIAGVFPPTEGQVYFHGEDITGLPAHEVTGRGIARTFQLVRLFPWMSVLENLLVGAQNQRGEKVVPALLQTPRVRHETERLVEKAVGLLKVTGMERLIDYQASDIPYGEQKMVEIMRALMGDPALILLDEPASGIQRALIACILDYVRYLQKEEGKTFIIVEHNMRVIMDTCDRIMVLNAGKKIAEGTPEEISRNPEVIQAYLGG